MWLGDWSNDRRVAGSILDTTDFLTNSSGHATNARMSRFTKQHKLVPAGYIAGCDTMCTVIPRSLIQESISWPKAEKETQSIESIDNV